MSARDSHVIHMQGIYAEVPIRALAQGFYEAVEEASAEGIADPSHDPAVMVLGAFIAFHVNADSLYVRGFHDLIEQCRARHEEHERRSAT